VTDWNDLLRLLIELCRAAVQNQHRVYIYEGADPEHALSIPATWTIEHGALD
jgi:hypothetical protein